MSPREKVKFEINIPQTITLAYSEGKIVSGAFGDQVMYSLADHKVCFLDMGVAQKINMLEPNAGESITLCKRNSKTWDVWLSPATEKLRAAREGGDGRTFDPDPERPQPEQQDLVPILEASIRAASERRYATLNVPKVGVNEKNGSGPTDGGTAPRTTNGVGHRTSDDHRVSPQANTAKPPEPSITQGWAQFLLSSTNALVDAYAAALAYASAKHGNSVKPEDVRALLTTAYIAQTKNGAPHVA